MICKESLLSPAKAGKHNKKVEQESRKRKKIMVRIIIYAVIFFGIFVWLFSNIFIKAYRPKTSNTPATFNISFEKITVKSKDGLDLAGWWIPSIHGKSRIVIIFCHGLGADKYQVMDYVPFLRENGYNILSFDFRGHGENKSKYTSLGYFEINDLLGAVDFVKTKGMKSIGVLGLSMGAATAIVAAKKTGDINAIVSDSGFARLAPLINRYAKRIYHISFTPLVSLVKKVAEIRISAKYDTVNPVDDIKDLKVPVLIIHGDKDENIPVENANMLYESAKEPKKLLIFPGATHVESHSIAQVKYEKEVLGFFKKYLKEK